MRKTIDLLLVVIMVAALFAACSHPEYNSVPAKEAVETANTGMNTDIHRAGLQLYLVKDNSAAAIDDKTDINTLELESEPLLSKSDIASYNWNMHCMKLKNDGKISRKLLQRRFVVMADGERIYSGVFWSAVFSMNPPKISVYLDGIDESSDSIILALGGWRPGEAITTDVEKTLGDSRIRKVLERDGQMYEAYKPEHFEKPDYISIINRDSQYGYGGYDWEKKDQLLRLLDQRFVQEMDFRELALSFEEEAALWNKETIVKLGYDGQRELKYNVKGEEKTILCREFVMPVTGKYSDSLLFCGTDGKMTGRLSGLERFNEIGLLKEELPHAESTSREEPEDMHLIYYKGRAFQHITYFTYELGNEDVKKIKEMVASGKALKRIPRHEPQILPLTLKFGKKDDRWFHVLDDGETLFSEGKYYYNPALAGRMLDIAREHCGFEIVDTSAFKGLVKAKYSFRTNTRTFERSTEDKAILTEMEKGLQKAQHDMGGGCPFSDGVLTLTFENGSAMEITMASDDCPLMFINGNFLKYSDELHDLLVRTFDNFPYVRH